ncbi:MAG: ECF-type sigma factor [Acidobacteriota bacterium]
MDPESQPPAQPDDVTVLLRAYADGDGDAFDDAVSLVYTNLRDIARRQLRKIRFGETLDTTGLVHEAYLKLMDQQGVDWQDRQHFFAISARAMRQIIVDHARRRSAQKRGGGEAAEELDEQRISGREDAEHILAVNDALESLARVDERMLQVVECRFFAGYSEQETADALGLSLRTSQRVWMRARAWLKEALVS